MEEILLTCVFAVSRYVTIHLTVYVKKNDEFFTAAPKNSNWPIFLVLHVWILEKITRKLLHFSKADWKCVISPLRRSYESVIRTSSKFSP